MSHRYDALIIGAGHNGLTCACYLTKAGLRVLVLEANENIGGLTITREVTLPAFHSDLHAFGYQFGNLSPVPDVLGLNENRLKLLTPEISFAHAFPDGRTVRMYADLEHTCASIATHSNDDAGQWRVLFQQWLAAKNAISATLNNPPRPLSQHLTELEHTRDGMGEYRFETQTLRSWTGQWVVHSPVDQEHVVSSAVHGTELQGAFVPYQTGAMRPIPELGQYRTPISNVYLCGSGSHPGPGVSFMPGRNAARVIFGDLGLDFGSIAGPGSP